MRHIVAVAFVAVTFLAVPVAAQDVAGPPAVPSIAAIIAGQSAGGIRIGTSIGDVTGLLGTLFQSEESESGKYTLYDWPLKPFAVAVEKESGNVVLILVGGTDAFHTDKGIAGGSDRDAVEAAYGKEYTTSDGRNSTRLIYDALGIAFDVGRSGPLSSKVTQIFVFVPGQWKAIMDNL